MATFRAVAKNQEQPQIIDRRPSHEARTPSRATNTHRNSPFSGNFRICRIPRQERTHRVRRRSERNLQPYTVNPDGSDQTQLTNLPPTSNGVWWPAFSPDGRRIAFSHDMSGQLELYLINADGTGFLQLTKADGTGKLFARWSPDGKSIVFARFDRRPELHQFDCSRRQGNLRPDYSALGGLSTDVHARWQGNPIRQSGGWPGLSNLDNQSGRLAQRRLTDAPIEAGGPDVSPDGRHVVFYSQQNTPLPTQIFAMHIDGAESHAANSRTVCISRSHLFAGWDENRLPEWSVPRGKRKPLHHERGWFAPERNRQPPGSTGELLYRKLFYS